MNKTLWRSATGNMGERCFRKHTCSTAGGSRFESGLALQQRSDSAATLFLFSLGMNKLQPVRSSSPKRQGAPTGMSAGQHGEHGGPRLDARRRFESGSLHHGGPYYRAKRYNCCSGLFRGALIEGKHIRPSLQKVCRHLLWLYGFGCPVVFSITGRERIAIAV